MSVLLDEPDFYLDAMLDVIARRHESAIHGSESRRWDE